MIIKRPNQYERIHRALRDAGKNGLTYLDLTITTRSNSPWKRLAEMETKGYIFSRWKMPYKGHHITRVSLISAPRG